VKVENMDTNEYQTVENHTIEIENPKRTMAVSDACVLDAVRAIANFFDNGDVLCKIKIDIEYIHRENSSFEITVPGELQDEFERQMKELEDSDE
jgi:hypothetical protein